MSVASGSDSRGAPDHTVNVLVALLSVLVDVGSDVGRVGLGVERAHGGHQGRHHGHWMGIVAESLDEGLEALVIRRVLHHLLGEARELLGCGELTIDKEESGLKEVGALRKLLNGVATVLKNTLLTVDEGDARDAVDSVHVGGIVGSSDSSCWALDLRQVSRVDCSILDGQLIVLASPVVNDTETVLSELLGRVSRAEVRIHLRKAVHFLAEIDYFRL